MRIKFNSAPKLDNELDYIKEVLDSGRTCGDSEYTKKCEAKLEEMTGSARVLLTTSCTQALEMAAVMADIGPGDEVIMPSYTFVSTANAFVLRGAKIVFVDVRPDTMNIDESLIEDAVTDKTKAIVPVHYAGVACEMDTIMDIAERHGLKVIEDAAQGVMASYKGRALGTIGDYGCFSFHETKNYSMGEGGAILIRDPENIESCEIFREKGTNRKNFLQGKVDKYTWVSMGSSVLPADINAAYLYPQLLIADEINEDRLGSWDRYYKGLKDLEEKGLLELPVIPEECSQNAHMFYIKVKDYDERGRLIKHLDSDEISSVFHYLPLHSSEAGKKFGVFHGEDVVTTRDSLRLLRLPMYYGLSEEDTERVIDSVHRFFDK